MERPETIINCELWHYKIFSRWNIFLPFGLTVAVAPNFSNIDRETIVNFDILKYSQQIEI